jgi:hypothetical protein
LVLVVGEVGVHVGVQHDAGERDVVRLAVAKFKREVLGEAGRQHAPHAVRVQLQRLAHALHQLARLLDQVRAGAGSGGSGGGVSALLLTRRAPRTA